MDCRLIGIVMKRIFILLVTLLCSNVYSQQISDMAEVAITQYEQWSIEGETYEIAQTVITGGALFTVHAVVEHQPVMDDYNRKIAKKIAIHAIKNGYLGNSLKYNNYNEEQFYINNEIIGVALIKIINPITREMSGSKFAFEVNELLPELSTIPIIESPETFTEKEQRNLIDNIKKIIKTRRFDDIYNLYSTNALKDINDDNKMQSRVFMSLVKEYIFEESESFTIYIGEKSGIKGFQYYLPIKVVPVSDDTLILDAYLQLTIIDDKPKYGLYGVMLNFVDYNSLRKLYTKSEPVEFEVLND